jgi:hypothetical protein
MDLVKAFFVVITSTILCTIIGGLLGWGVGTYAPGYYRAAFVRGRDPDFDPVHVGLGCGINAGVFTGVVLGIAIVAILSWYELRKAQADQHSKVANRPA